MAAPVGSVFPLNLEQLTAKRAYDMEAGISGAINHAPPQPIIQHPCHKTLGKHMASPWHDCDPDTGEHPELDHLLRHTLPIFLSDVNMCAWWCRKDTLASELPKTF